MSTSCSTKFSNKLCPECKEINNTEVKLKEIKITNTQIVTLLMNIPNSGTVASSQTIKIEIKLYQCPCCKTIYDEEVHTPTNKSNWKSQYASLMEEYDLGGKLPNYD